MIDYLSIIGIFIISLLLAVASSRKELSIPEEIKKLRLDKRKGMSGVILFLKEKIIHYA